VARSTPEGPAEHLVESLTRGNVTEVKVVLASVALALGAYQLLLIAAGYGKLRLRVLAGRPASAAHRASGDVIAALLVVTTVMCISYFGFEEDGLHATFGILLLAVLALKILVLRRLHALSRLLPALGLSVFVLLAVPWATSAGGVLLER
jgi:hypothetical protein